MRGTGRCKVTAARVTAGWGLKEDEGHRLLQDHHSPARVPVALEWQRQRQREKMVLGRRETVEDGLRARLADFFQVLELLVTSKSHHRFISLRKVQW